MLATDQAFANIIINVKIQQTDVQTVTVRVCVSECSKACARGNPVQEIVQPYAAPIVSCPSATVLLTWLSSKSFLSSVCTLHFAESENINKRTNFAPSAHFDTQDRCVQGQAEAEASIIIDYELIFASHGGEINNKEHVAVVSTFDTHVM